MTLNDNYAPNDIYNNIINLKFNNEASVFITIPTDFIKKKIIKAVYIKKNVTFISHFYIYAFKVCTKCLFGIYININKQKFKKK